MPRRTSNSEEAPLARRSSARIAAAQASSPSKSPAKSSPRRKRQSTESSTTPAKEPEQNVTDTSEINGSNASESVSNVDDDVPQKKIKMTDSSVDNVETPSSEQELATESVSSIKCTFETAEQAVVLENEDVKEAVVAQNETKLSVSSVQVEASVTPVTNTLEVKQINTFEIHDQVTKTQNDNQLCLSAIGNQVNNINGNSDSLTPKKDNTIANGSTEINMKHAVSLDQPSGDKAPVDVLEPIEQH